MSSGEGARLGVLVIVLLVLAWAVVLVPSFLRPRFESSAATGIREFERSMGILASTRHTPQPPGRWVMVPKDMASPKRRRERVMFRRRRIFARLLLLAGVTLVLGLIPPLRVVLMAHLGVDLALVVYVFQLRRWRRAELERARVVHELTPEGVDDIPPDEAAFRSG